MLRLRKWPSKASDRIFGCIFNWQCYLRSNLLQTDLRGESNTNRVFVIDVAMLVAMLVSAQSWGQLFTLAPEIPSAKGAMGRICGLFERLSRNQYSDLVELMSRKY